MSSLSSDNQNKFDLSSEGDQDLSNLLMNSCARTTVSTESNFFRNCLSDQAFGFRTSHNYPAWLRHAKTHFEKDFGFHLKNDHKSSTIWPVIRHAVIPGRRIRPSLYYAFWKNITGRFPTAEERIPAVAIELFHAASIVVDDIADGELCRRNKKPAFREFDVNTAILVSHHLVASAFRQIECHPKSSVLFSIATRCYIQAIDGQAHDLGLDRSSPLWTQHEKAIQKTVSFFRFIGESLDQLLPISNPDFCTRKDYFEILGEAFQIGNDVTDLLYFEQSQRHDAHTNYALRPSKMVHVLIEANVIDPNELYLPLPFARHVEISRRAIESMRHSPTIMENILELTLTRLAKLTISNREREMAADFILQTVKPSFWLHSHE